MERDAEKTHWGSGEVLITGVRLLNRHGQPIQLLQSGEPLSVEIHYKVQEQVPSTVFGIAIYRSDGLWCYGTNTDIEAIDLSDLPNRGVICVDFPSLGLIAGTYTLDLAVHGIKGPTYDHYHPYCTFSVRSHIQDVGVYRPEHHWRIQEG